MSILQSCLPASLHGATPTNQVQCSRLVLQQAAFVVSHTHLHNQYQGMFQCVSTQETILGLSKLMSTDNNQELGLHCHKLTLVNVKFSNSVTIRLLFMPNFVVIWYYSIIIM